MDSNSKNHAETNQESFQIDENQESNSQCIEQGDTINNNDEKGILFAIKFEIDTQLSDNNMINIILYWIRQHLDQ